MTKSHQHTDQAKDKDLRLPVIRIPGIKRWFVVFPVSPFGFIGVSSFSRGTIDTATLVVAAIAAVIEIACFLYLDHRINRIRNEQGRMPVRKDVVENDC